MLAKIAHLFVAVLIAAFVYLIFIILSGVNTGSRTQTVDMVYGDAHKPYVYRALLPMTARVISELTPDQIRDDFNHHFAQTDFVNNIPRDIYAIDDNHLYEIFLVMLLMYLCLVGFIYSIRYMTAGVFEISKARNNIASLVAVLLLIQGLFYGYIYDLSALFLTTLALGFLARGKLRYYIILFPFVTLNKETSILLTFVYWLHFRDMLDKRTFNTYLGLQIAIFLGIKGGLYWIFRDNLGDSLEFHLPEHFIEYHRIFVKFPHLMIYYLLLLIGTPAIMAYRWEEKPIFLRRAILMFMPLFFLYLLFGYPFELRVFYEVYPVIFLIMLHSIGRLLGRTIKEPVWNLSPSSQALMDAS